LGSLSFLENFQAVTVTIGILMHKMYPCGFQKLEVETSGSTGVEEIYTEKRITLSNVQKLRLRQSL
jgi:hypothetical protein